MQKFTVFEIHEMFRCDWNAFRRFRENPCKSIGFFEEVVAMLFHGGKLKKPTIDNLDSFSGYRKNWAIIEMLYSTNSIARYYKLIDAYDEAERRHGGQNRYELDEALWSLIIQAFREVGLFNDSQESLQDLRQEIRETIGYLNDRLHAETELAASLGDQTPSELPAVTCSP